MPTQGKGKIFETLHLFDHDKITNKHLRSEYLKHKIDEYFKNLVKEKNEDQNVLKKN